MRGIRSLAGDMLWPTSEVKMAKLPLINSAAMLRITPPPQRFKRASATIQTLVLKQETCYPQSTRRTDFPTTTKHYQPQKVTQITKDLKNQNNAMRTPVLSVFNNSC